MNKENYVYPAKLIRNEESLALEFYDFDCYVEEADMSALVESAQTELALAIIDKLDRCEKLPDPSSIEEGAIYVHVWLPFYRNSVKEVYVRKSVTIPQWLDIMAKEREVNFSAALVYGLRHKLGLSNYSSMD